MSDNLVQSVSSEDGSQAEPAFARSSIWNYFKSDGATGKSACNHCNVVVSAGRFSTNLKKHLEKHHLALIKQFQTEETKKGTIKSRKRKCKFQAGN